MASSTSARSKTLQSITLTKIRELEKQRERYEAQKNQLLQDADSYADQLVRIRKLLHGVVKICPDQRDDSIENIHHWLNQAKYDNSVPQELVDQYEHSLRSKLEVPTRKLSLGHLYARLVTEWMDSSAGDGEATAAEEDSFEVLDRQKQRLQELCDHFEQVVFEPLETDEKEIQVYLQNLFEPDHNEKATKNFGQLKQKIAGRCRILFERNNRAFDLVTLRWCIKGLLKEDLLSEEKQVILREFLDDDVVLDEIADVLNMRVSDFENWDWNAGPDGIPVLPRQQLNGKYRIWMDEDVLQAIFIYYFGTTLSILLKNELETLVFSSNSLWKTSTGSQPDSDQETRRKYYMAYRAIPPKSADAVRMEQYRNHFFLSALPDDVDSIPGAYDDDDGDDEDRSDDGDDQGSKSTKQRLLETLATELLLHRSLNGEVAMVQTDLQWFGAGLSHSTILAVLRFFGFTDAAVSFFKKFLEAPLNIHSPEFPNGKGARVRRRGMPMAHAPEKLIGELVLFILDVAVNQQDGMLLYRQHDDLWFVGEPEHCGRAWKTLKHLAGILGLEFNEKKTGSVYFKEGKRDAEISQVLPEGAVRFGHLILDPETEKWKINQDQVDAHLKQFKKQLDECKSVLQWVQTWNSVMGRFFGDSFGQPAYCFGGEHVRSILETYQSMQRFLFAEGRENDRESNTSVVSHLRKMIETRFGVINLPDAFFYLPEQLGGLGLRNPFIKMLQINRELEGETPQKIIEEMLRKEQEAYKEAKREFYAIESAERRVSRCTRHFALSASTLTRLLTEEELETFFSMEEFIKWRARYGFEFVDAYKRLRSAPDRCNPRLDSDVNKAVRTASSSSRQGAQVVNKSEVEWALQMHRESLKRDYGQLSLIEHRYLLLGVLAALRGKPVRWTMVL
ncbi:unnamed protein product [Clonostachys byssicola]|uniref:Reverse transcriptase domain-containing protein n=1 Tax=Clonostachys byssicola TaxID=160290 RepID=A0A9N9UF82_9HYPO|nr:unnamed protein product [Clonostachys byssicola]